MPPLFMLHPLSSEVVDFGEGTMETALDFPSAVAREGVLTPRVTAHIDQQLGVLILTHEIGAQTPTHPIVTAYLAVPAGQGVLHGDVPQDG
jgi:hypothetical protein